MTLSRRDYEKHLLTGTTWALTYEADAEHSAGGRSWTPPTEPISPAESLGEQRYTEEVGRRVDIQGA